MDERIRQWDEDNEVTIPADADAFDQDMLTGGDRNDWPGWPAQEMLAWVPADVQRRYGEVIDTVLSGEYLAFREADLPAIAADLDERGYRCRRDDSLVSRASGMGS